ncbi:MAG: amino acid ABC transporter substrate-binding protein [Synechococcales cyanobacterium T60_A2020_003]|nr:amino acid ABC transporter substrate-binding protein [Synechococcales cyanobacterium T60_A2020_003]
MRKWGFLLAAAGMVALTGCGGGTTTSADSPDATAAPGAGASRLDTVTERGELVCGVDGGIPGFSFVDSSGQYSGLDVDVCKAVAAAIFGDASKVQYRNLDSTERFTALAGGEVDMLSRNTTWTSSRDAAGGNGLEFAPTTFYDGQGMMIRADSGIESLEDFEGKSICVETGTTTELNLTDRMRELNVTFTPVVFQDADAAYAAFAEGRCEGMTSDKSQLAARRTTLPSPDDFMLMDVTMSKEPLAPVTINNDSRWFDAVKWVTYGLIQAEEFGITQANVDEMLNSESPDIRRFLGVEGDLGTQLGLPNDFMVSVIKAVGNYGEIYDRNVGEGSELKIPRGYNALWTDGGLMYAPPFR